MRFELPGAAAGLIPRTSGFDSSGPHHVRLAHSGEHLFETQEVVGSKPAAYAKLA